MEIEHRKVLLLIKYSCLEILNMSCFLADHRLLYLVYMYIA